MEQRFYFQMGIAEKVALLASNPYRYYTAPGVALERNESRITELDRLLDEAKALNDFDLCKAIVEVKQQLYALYRKPDQVEVVFTDMIAISYTTLVVRRERIETLYGLLPQFLKNHGLGGVYNEHLYCISEMVYPALYLQHLIDTLFIPMGLKPQEDFCILSEQLLTGHYSIEIANQMYSPHPDCEAVSWLGSVLLPSGNWICYINPEVQSQPKIIPNVFYQYMRRVHLDKMDSIPKITRITANELIFKLEEKTSEFSIPLDTLLVLNEIRERKREEYFK